jgi:hypothetical protein
VAVAAVITLVAIGVTRAVLTVCDVATTAMAPEASRCTVKAVPASRCFSASSGGSAPWKPRVLTPLTSSVR